MIRSMLLAALLAAPPVLAAGPVVFGPDLTAEGWETLDFRGRTPAVFRADGPNVLRVGANAAVSVLYRTLPQAFAGAQTATWRWRVDGGPPPTDLAQRGGDDRALALYFLFADDETGTREPPADLRTALRQGRALIYVWGGDQPVGTAQASPHLRGRGMMVMKQSAGAGDWRAEEVRLREDFRRVFGEAPGPLVAVAVSSDSDDTGAATQAAIEALRLR